MDWKDGDFGLMMKEPQTKRLERYATSEEVLWIKERIALGDIPRQFIADAVGVHPTIVSKILHGGRKMSREEWERARTAIEQLFADPQKRIERLLSFSYESNGQLAAATGISAHRIQELKSNSGQAITDEEAEVVKDHFRLAAIVDDSGGSGWDPKREELIRRAQTFSLPRRLAPLKKSEEGPDRLMVMGGLRRLPDGFFSDELIPAEQRQIPTIGTIIGVYGLIVSGPYLLPRFEEGEVLILHPHRPPLTGRWAIAFDGQGRLSIGKVLRRRDDQIELAVPGEYESVRVDLRHQDARIASIVGTWAE